MGRNSNRKTEIDIAIGNRVRTIRMARHMSQEALGDALGVTFQQIQKYEKGTNAIASTRVHALCTALGITPDQLYGTANGGEKKEINAKDIAGLSAMALRVALKIDRLSADQRKAIVVLVDSFGADDGLAA
jgi:transcriptional regulator with XRE-family HTH domain